MFLEVKRVKTNDSFIVSSEYILTYLKWMEYIPKHWNIEELLNKKACELSNEDMQILKFINEENKHKNIFKQSLKENKKTITISDEIHKYMGKMPIDKYASIKLTEEEINYCKEIVSNCVTIEQIDSVLTKLKEKEQRTLIDEYILFELDKKQYKVGIENLNREIKKAIEENRKDVLNGYEKCINTRNRF